MSKIYNFEALIIFIQITLKLFQKTFPVSRTTGLENWFCFIKYHNYIKYHTRSSDWVECDIWFLSLLIWDSNVFETYPTKFLKVERKQFDGVESSFIFEWVSRLPLAFSSSIWAMKICFRSCKIEVQRVLSAVLTMTQSKLNFFQVKLVFGVLSAILRIINFKISKFQKS